MEVPPEGSLLDDITLEKNSPESPRRADTVAARKGNRHTMPDMVLTEWPKRCSLSQNGDGRDFQK